MLCFDYWDVAHNAYMPEGQIMNKCFFFATADTPVMIFIYEGPQI
jgi:hypothetical protein